MTQEPLRWVLKSLVADELYTDRQEFLDFFYKEARRAATRRSMSTVLLGRRRMGKTEIFRRVVNQLFFDQDPLDPMSVVPVYYSFSDTVQDRWQFATGYLENFIRYFVGFYTRRPEIILEPPTENTLISLAEAAKSTHPYPRSLERLVYWYEGFLQQKITSPEKVALEIPRIISDVNDSTIVMFWDEFQNTRLPQYKFDIVGWTKEAVESPTCPHFVTGSAMSILAREIIGRGSLFGRFESKPIEPLSVYWGTEQALRSARYYGAELPELMASIVATRCGGNPFYINAVIRQAVAKQIALTSEEAINTVLAVDISSGFIWAELHEQVSGWIQRVNDVGITKWILYLSALETEDRISLNRIRQTLLAREGKEVSLDQIRDVLVKLSRGDLLEYLELGGWFRKIDDPILLEFLKVWGRVEVEGQDQNQVQADLVKRYKLLDRQIIEYQGYLAEVFMGQVLFNSQDKSKLPLPGRFFNSRKDIPMGWPLSYVRHRVRLKAGQGQEIDVLAAVGGDMWVCQSKWVHKKVNSDVIDALLAQGEAVRAEYEPIALHLWLFAHEGLTKAAERLARKQGLLWSNREQLDGLLTYLGLRQLPDLQVPKLS